MEVGTPSFFGFWCLGFEVSGTAAVSPTQSKPVKPIPANVGCGSSLGTARGDARPTEGRKLVGHRRNHGGSKPVKPIWDCCPPKDRRQPTFENLKLDIRRRWRPVRVSQSWSNCQCVRPPSSRPSPPGEGELSAVPGKHNRFNRFERSRILISVPGAFAARRSDSVKPSQTDIWGCWARLDRQSPIADSQSPIANRR